MTDQQYESRCETLYAEHRRRHAHARENVEGWIAELADKWLADQIDVLDRCQDRAWSAQQYDDISALQFDRLLSECGQDGGVRGIYREEGMRKTHE